MLEQALLQPIPAEHIIAVHRLGNAVRSHDQNAPRTRERDGLLLKLLVRHDAQNHPVAEQFRESRQCGRSRSRPGSWPARTQVSTAVIHLGKEERHEPPGARDVRRETPVQIRR